MEASESFLTELNQCFASLEALAEQEAHLHQWYDVVKVPESIGGAMMEMLATDVRVHQTLGLKTQAYKHLSVEAAQDLYMSGIFSAIGDTVTTIYDKLLEIIQKFLAWIKKLFTGKDSEDTSMGGGGGGGGGSSTSTQTKNIERVHAAQQVIANAPKADVVAAAQTVAQTHTVRSIPMPSLFFQDINTISNADGIMYKISGGVMLAVLQFNDETTQAKDLGAMLDAKLNEILVYYNAHMKLTQISSHRSMALLQDENQFISLSESTDPSSVLPVEELKNIHSKLIHVKETLKPIASAVTRYESQLMAAGKGYAEHSKNSLQSGPKNDIELKVNASRHFILSMIALTSNLRTIYDHSLYNKMMYIIPWYEAIVRELEKAKPADTTTTA